jgi:hypothetical protein
VIINGDLAKDDRAAYCKNREISDDPAHFESLCFSPGDGNPDYTKDIHTVHDRCDAIPGADPHTFRVLYDTANEGCAGDAQHAYRWDTVIPQATFGP